ncbi:hypothetical protein [Streptomyces sp. NPDC048385]|uniref:hypothetical protein n=1 Tax=unclassified Streptomyces TaxID=2593676 RepID=UPI003437CD95
MTDVVAGHPAFEVVLAAGGKSQVLVFKPVEEIDAGPQVLTDDDALGVRDVLATAATAATAASAKTAKEVPSRVLVQDLASFGGRVGGDEVFHLALEADHLLVPLRQGVGGHEDTADVLDDLALRQLVQSLVCQGPASGAEV